MEEEESQQDRYLTEEKKWAIVISIKHFGLSYQEVSNKFGMHKGTISKVYNKYLKQGNIDNNFQNCKRPTLIDENLERKVEDIIGKLKNSKYSSQQIQNYLEIDEEIKISRSTLVKCLKKLQFKYGKIKYVPIQTEENKKQRVQHSRLLLRTPGILKRIVYTDESLFQVNENGIEVWHRDNEDRQIQREQVSYKNKQIMIWGGISHEGKTQIYFHEESVNSNTYIQCLEQALFPMTIESFGDNEWYLLQDGARSHTSKVTTQWLENNNVTLIQNPPWSPDINPIELIWAFMKRIFKKHQLHTKITTRDELKQVIQQIWNEIDQSLIDNCIAHTKQQLQVVIDNNGQIIY